MAKISNAKKDIVKTIQQIKLLKRLVWLLCCIILALSIIFSAIKINLILTDIRRVTSQLSIDDIRRVFDIIENQQELEMRKDSIR